jgi:hypothetical protein
MTAAIAFRTGGRLARRRTLLRFCGSLIARLATPHVDVGWRWR